MKRAITLTALIAATLVAGSSLPVFAQDIDTATPDPKVWVCKYVGTPGEDEAFKDGKNPIDVSTNATVGEYFNDAQGRSFVLAVKTAENTDEDTNTYNGTLDCPQPDVPPPPPTPRSIELGTAVCGDPRVIFFGTGPETGMVINYVRAVDGERVVKTINPPADFFRKYWVKGKTAFRVFDAESGALLTRQVVNRANNIGACPVREDIFPVVVPAS